MTTYNLSQIMKDAHSLRRNSPERLAKLKEQKYASVEAECVAYGYGRGNHYSDWSGWGNYCGD